MSGEMTWEQCMVIARRNVAHDIEHLEAEIRALKRDVAGQTRSAQNGWRNSETHRTALATARRQIEAALRIVDEMGCDGLGCSGDAKLQQQFREALGAAEGAQP